MFTVNISTQKITDAEKILALGNPDNMAKIDFALVDAAGEAVNAENCQFELMIGDTSCPRYKTDSNTVSFRYIALEIAKAETDFSLNMKKDGADILNDSIKVTAEVQGGEIVLPEVTVTADKMLKDITAINTSGEVVTGSISDAVITTAQTNGLTVNVSKGYVAADETRAFDPSIVTETDTQVTISRGWLAEDKAFQVGGGSSDVQGIVFDNKPSAATTVQVIPPSFTADWTDFSNMFKGCYYLTSIPTTLNTSNGTSFNSMFENCQRLTSIPTTLNTSNGTNFSRMFYACGKLTSMPQLNLSSGTNFGEMFYSCQSLISMPQLNVSSGTSFRCMFQYCKALTTIPQLTVSQGISFDYMFHNCAALTDFGGLLNVKKSFSLSDSKQLTHQSLLNVLNGLYDLTGSTSQTLSLGSTNLAKLSDEEKAIATNKNWVLA